MWGSESSLQPPFRRHDRLSAGTSFDSEVAVLIQGHATAVALGLSGRNATEVACPLAPRLEIDLIADRFDLLLVHAIDFGKIVGFYVATNGNTVGFVGTPSE